jgi:uroporphyrinogen-III decarboxylase
MVESMSPLAQLPPLYSLLEARHLVMLGGTLAGTPEFHDLLQKMVDLGNEVMAYTTALNAYYEEMEDLGFPISYRTIGRAPFEGITDFLRGMKGSMLDMYRVPDKLLAAIDLIAPLMTQFAITGAIKSENPRVFVPLHRGADGYMSDEQFKRFYWPSLKRMLLYLADAGLTPMPFFEATYNSRLEYLTELPPGKMVGHFEIVDRKKAKKIIGDTMCFWGNVSAQLLVNGTPQQVKDDVKDLIDTFGDNGGLIVDGSVSVPDEANPRNVAAMVEAVFDYGAY